MLGLRRREDEPLVVLTTASEIVQYMPSFLDSFHRRGLQPVILGLGMPWPGNGMKIRLIYDFVRRLRPRTLVLFSDAYDSFVTQDAREITARFRSYHHPLVFTAEKNCWPFEELAPRYLPSPTPYRFLNAGGWIGRAGYVTSLMRRWNAAGVPADLWSEQGWWSTHLAREPWAIALDVHCRLFQTIVWAEDDLEERGGVYNTVTGTHPAVIHGNVRSDLTRYLEWSGLPVVQPLANPRPWGEFCDAPVGA